MSGLTLPVSGLAWAWSGRCRQSRTHSWRLGNSGPLCGRELKGECGPPGACVCPRGPLFLPAPASLWLASGTCSLLHTSAGSFPGPRIDRCVNRTCVMGTWRTRPRAGSCWATRAVKPQRSPRGAGLPGALGSAGQSFRPLQGGGGGYSTQPQGLPLCVQSPGSPGGDRAPSAPGTSQPAGTEPYTAAKAITGLCLLADSSYIRATVRPSS